MKIKYKNNMVTGSRVLKSRIPYMFTQKGLFSQDGIDELISFYQFKLLPKKSKELDEKLFQEDFAV